MCHTISFLDHDQGLSFVNQAFLDMTGYRREEVIGRNCRFLQGPDTDMQTVEKISQGIKNHTDIDVEILNYRKDDSPFWNRLRIATIFDDQDIPVALIGVQSLIENKKV
jgi:PAS domain S-box-containing protein